MMGNLPTIKVKMENDEKEIVVSPFLLQSKQLPNLQPGKVNILYFYYLFPIEEYKTTFEQDLIAASFRSDDGTPNYLQDFENTISVALM